MGKEFSTIRSLYFWNTVSFLLDGCGVARVYLATLHVGRIAQLGEHRPYKPRVTGSIPVSPTTRGVVVQLVRIPACHARGRGFEPRPLRQLKELKGLAITANPFFFNLFFRFAVFLGANA